MILALENSFQSVHAINVLLFYKPSGTTRNLQGPADQITHRSLTQTANLRPSLLRPNREPSAQTNTTLSTHRPTLTCLPTLVMLFAVLALLVVLDRLVNAHYY